MKHIQSLSLTLLLLITSFSVTAQIVTSKKEAQAKGIYSYAEKPSSAKIPTSSSQQKSQVRQETVAAVDALTANVAPAPAVSAAPAKAEKPAKKEEPKKNKKAKKEEVAVKDEPTPAGFTPDPYESYFAQQVVNNAMQFEGVRYRGGGTTPAGMDCSGMVYATFQIFDVTLPRSSADMAANAGHEIKLGEVKKGDLLFFDNNPYKKRVNHVGLVTEVTEEGEVKFIHSTLSSGVIVSSMNEPYYIKTYVQANRVIDDIQ
ncbi:C40 family peptidase [Flavobacterium akiainvivens]|uniref:C40 family peptidase n=1 Tax=Flavobacterium akiainvivens TaxID=1202724 RepID=UPI0006C85D7C|nr:C40 family peptidase [Flavobacterium akiainvivens]SFQ24786.1 Cell wall-associated hydrolase, NlpC family [Flavobacterium akiainvivens]